MRAQPTRVAVGLVALLLLLFGPAIASAQPAHAMEAKGAPPNHGSLSFFPWEHIDGFTGNAVLSFQDLLLPGPGGFNLVVTRTYNSKSRGWHWAVSPSLIPSFSGGAHPVVVGVDGSEVATLHGPDGSYLTPSFGRVRWTGIDHVVEEPNGVVYHFGATGLLNYMEDAYGHLIVVTRDADQRITELFQTLGGGAARTVVFTYDGTSTAPTTISCNGRTWTYGYGPTTVNGQVVNNGTLRSVQPPEGPAWQFEATWDQFNPGLGTEYWEDTLTITMSTSGTVKYTSRDYRYGPVNEQDTSWSTKKIYERTTNDQQGHVWTLRFDYVDNGRYTYVRDVAAPDWYWAGFTHEPFNADWPTPVLRSMAGSGIDATEILDWMVLYVGEASRGADQVPLADEYTYLPARVRVTRDGRTYQQVFSYNWPNHHFGQPIQVVESGDTESVTTTYGYQAFTGGTYLRDRVNAITVTRGQESFTAGASYDTTGFMESQTVNGVTTTFTRNDGQLASQTDANGHTTRFDYDWGVVSAVHTPEHSTVSGINAFGETIWTRQRGFTTEFWYDGLGRQIRVIPPEGNATITSYAGDGRSVTVSRGPSWTRTDLDPFGRAVHTENSQWVQTAATYDVLGRTTGTSQPYLGPTPWGWTEITHDGLGRVRLTKNPDGSTVQYAYGSVPTGLETQITDEEGSVTTQVWQAVGAPGQAQLASVTDAAGQTTSYAYNLLGSLTDVASPGGVTRAWRYNAQNRLVSQTQPESGTVTYTYDAVGNMAAQNDAKNQTTSYAYDGNNRLRQVTSWDPASSATFTYDASNNRTSVSNAYATTTFEYDAANRLRRRTDVVRKTGQGAGRAFESTYTPDDNGNIVEVRYPSGNAVQYRYDSENRVTDVFDVARGETFAGAITYHPTGGLAGFTGGDGSQQTIAYDDRARPRRVAGQGVANLLDLTYTYDRVGNVTRIDDVRLVPGTSQPTTAYTALFGYDELDRLTSATGGGWGTLTYGYDPLGNRSQKTHNGATTGYQYTAQWLTGTTGTAVASFGYDPNGNLTSDPVGTYTYGPSNMLATATLNAGALSTYRYDGDGQRVTKQLGAGTTTYYLRGLGQVLSEVEEEGTQARWTVDYVHVGARLLAAVRPVTGTATLTLGLLGAGAGTVASSPQGSSCGPDCQTFATGTVVTLTATPGAGLLFAGWSGDADCADGVVTLGRPTACYATFAQVMPVFRKVAPAPFSTEASRSRRLEWTVAPGAQHLVCWDTTNNDACDTGWVPTWGLTSHVIDALASGTYYWQVKTAGGEVAADAGTWWRFTVTVPAIPPDHWTAEYFANATLTLPAVRTDDEGAGFLRHDWGSGSPAGLPPNDFSARYTRTITLTAPGRYRFFVLTDDGARLWVDGALVMDAWRAMTGPTIFTTVQELGAGSHTLRLEYSSGDGPATVRLAWQDMATAILGPAEALRPGDVKASADGQYTVTYQADANLVVRRQNGAVAWATGTAGAGTALQVTMQNDGNLVLYVNDWAPVWATGTAGTAGRVAGAGGGRADAAGSGGQGALDGAAGDAAADEDDAGGGGDGDRERGDVHVDGGGGGELPGLLGHDEQRQACNASWVDAGGATTLTVTGVAPGTYWWQVKTAGGGVEADDGAWRALTVVAAPSFGKLAPATGTTGLGNNVTLTWSAYGSDGYWVCWDTVHNNACDTLWWPASTATTGLENLAPGTYYWQVKTGVTGVLADGGTWWSFTVTTPLVPPDHWKAEYFGNQELSGAAVALVDEGTGFVDHSWGDGGPAGLADHFSARFTRTVTLAAGRYRFTVTTDDGSRLWVDGQLTIDAWWPQGPTGHTAEVDLAGGGHTLRVRGTSSRRAERRRS